MAHASDLFASDKSILRQLAAAHEKKRPLCPSAQPVDSLSGENVYVLLDRPFVQTRQQILDAVAKRGV